MSVPRVWRAAGAEFFGAVWVRPHRSSPAPPAASVQPSLMAAPSDAGPFARHLYGPNSFHGALTPLEFRRMRSLPHRAAQPTGLKASLSLQGNEWRPSISAAMPDSELAQAQTLAEFSHLNLGDSSRGEGDASTAAGRAEESLVTLSGGGAHKHTLELSTPDERPSKRRRGLAGTLVQGAVSAAYSLWNSWAYKDDDHQGGSDELQSVDERPSLAAVCGPNTDVACPPGSKHQPDFVNSPTATARVNAASFTPSRTTQPTRTVYLSNRRRRAVIPSQRRRASSRLPNKKGQACFCSPSPFSPTADTPSKSGTISSTPSPSPQPSWTHTMPECPHDADDAGAADDSGQEEDALTRMQCRLDSMITQCQTALSSRPDLDGIDADLSREGALYDMSSSPSQGHRAAMPESVSIYKVRRDAEIEADACPAAPPPTPNIFTDCAPASSGRFTPTLIRSSTPRPPSRIPVPVAPPRVRPPASAFAFQMRPSSRASNRLPEPGAPDSPIRWPSATSPGCNAGTGASPRTGSRPVGHRYTESASKSFSSSRGTPSLACHRRAASRAECYLPPSPRSLCRNNTSRPASPAAFQSRIPRASSTPLK